MKKLTVISFLLVIFINQLGYYFYYSYQQYRIREEIKHQLLMNLPETELEVIVEEDQKGKLSWEEYNEEFHLNGEMYDVARIEIKDGKRLLHCINDKKEKKLLDHLAKVIRDNSDDARKQSRSGKNIVKYQLVDFEQPVNEILQGIPQVPKPHYACYTTPLFTSVKEIKGPPPKA